jgi:hypothetical protein
MNPNTNILEVAKKVPRLSLKNGHAKYVPMFSQEAMIQLSLAWLRGEVSSQQAAIALKTPSQQKNHSNVMFIFAGVLRRAVLEGKVKIS